MFMHWGIYSVPAHQSEWYEKHMYGTRRSRNGTRTNSARRTSSATRISFRCSPPPNWNADAWAEFFKKSGAKFIIPTAEHHDGFAIWDSAVNPFNAKQMGPHRDLIGDLSKAVRKQGLKFGVSNHGIENFTLHPADRRADE